MPTRRFTEGKHVGRVDSTEVIYDDEELEFLKAVDAWKRKTGRQFPTCSELLEILRALGWRKVSGGQDGDT